MSSEIPEPELDLDDKINFEYEGKKVKGQLVYCRKVDHDNDPPREQWDVWIRGDDEDKQVTIWLNVNDLSCEESPEDEDSE